MDRDNRQPTEPDEFGRPTNLIPFATPSSNNEEVFATILARLSELQGNMDALLLGLLTGDLSIAKEDRSPDSSDFICEAKRDLIIARAGYLIRQFPQLKKLIWDDIWVGLRSTREIFARLQSKGSGFHEQTDGQR
jgi:hypothetical protein